MWHFARLMPGRVLFALTKSCLAFLGEDFWNRTTSLISNHVISIHELKIEHVCGDPTDGGLAAAALPDDKRAALEKDVKKLLDGDQDRKSVV